MGHRDGVGNGGGSSSRHGGGANICRSIFLSRTFKAPS